MPLPEVTTEIVAELRKEEGLVTRRLEEERNNAAQLKARIEDIWKDDTSAAYELTSVFIHRGSSPSWGHYFFYSRNLPDHPDQWFKYNDSSVSVVSQDEVFADTTGSTANPYMVRLPVSCFISSYQITRTARLRAQERGRHSDCAQV